MPDTPSTSTLIHFIVQPTPDRAWRLACSGQQWAGDGTSNVGEVTCFACRKTPAFKQAQRVDAVVAQLPIKLSGVMADDAHLAALREEAEAKFDLNESRNERRMFTIEEFIHHGDYRSRRFVEVYDINPVTVDAVLQSSAYCYGSWAHAEPPHTEVRRAHLHQLVDDLRHGRTNRAIGWSTFRLL